MESGLLCRTSGEDYTPDGIDDRRGVLQRNKVTALKVDFLSSR